MAEQIATSLFNAGLYDKAGDIYKTCNAFEKAMNAYTKGKVFQSAVDLARVAFPQEVVKIEEKWGDYLVSIRQTDASINHFIEAGNTTKAIDAAIEAKQVSQFLFCDFINIDFLYSGKKLLELSKVLGMLKRQIDIFCLWQNILLKCQITPWQRNFMF